MSDGSRPTSPGAATSPAAATIPAADTSLTVPASADAQTRGDDAPEAGRAQPSSPAEGEAAGPAQENSPLEHQRVVGAAVGITMTRYGMGYADAMNFLQDLGARHGRGLLDLARAITTSRWPVADPFDPARDGSPVGRLEHTPRESAAGRLLDLLVETTDLNELLVAVADLAVESIPGCDSASITVIRAGEPATVASSDAHARRVDEMQYAGGQGPCLQAARTDEVVEFHHLATSPGPGVWRRVAVDAGLNAVLALPIASDADIAAALNLYTHRSRPWSSSDQEIGENLATYTGAAITLAYRRGDGAHPLNRS